MSKSATQLPVKRRPVTTKARSLALTFVLLAGLAVVALVVGLVLTFTPHAKVDADRLTWPESGHGALVWGDLEVSSPGAPAGPLRPGSIAKIITALVVLERAPLEGDQEGPAFLLTEADTARAVSLASDDAATAPAPAGTTVTERQALALALVSSACNYAELIAERIYGSLPAFLDAAQRWLTDHGLDDTYLADACGVSPQTVSTADDLLTLAAIAHADPVVATIAAQPFVMAPDGSFSKSLNTLLGVDGVDGLKTGHPGDEGYLLIATAPVEGQNATVLVWNTPSAAQRGTDALRILASLRAMVEE